ncbi:MAG TPA: LTA synthase family protein [Cyclobacteriaceae bacterium]|nr:LTA synthase family protein [Cyclobacteriaceae bacterium]
MKQRLTLFGFLGLYWMTYYTVSRILFLVYHSNLTSALSWTDILTVMALGSRMDAAISADCLVLTGLLLTVSCFYNRKLIGIVNHFIVGCFIVISAIVVVADMELYRHWGFRMDSTPLMYVGEEGAGSVSPGTAIILISLLLLLIVPAWLVYWKKIAPRFKHLPEVRSYNAVFMLLVTGLLSIPIRSSFSVAPLNTGVVYFHKTNQFANHAGINVIWNFFESVADDKEHLYPNDFFDNDEAQKLLTSMTAGSGDVEKIINTDRPNVLLIVLESFTARIVEPLGGVPGITPELNQLVREGILFDNFYASGDRTDKGMVAILSGYPAQPRSSVIKYPNKTEYLPFLSRSLEKEGYHTSFVYGGDIGFANMESYLTTAGFSHVTEDDDFPSSLNQSKWGIHDHFVFDRLLEECDTATTPFFKMMLTLSSHEPFDVPLDPPFRKGPDERDMFLNACHYTDKSLGDFIRKARTKEWWKNTWVIITADHGHRFPDAKELQEKGRFRIPMLWLGGAVSKSDTVVHATGSQTDIGNSVLSQIGKSSPDFKFSKDIMDRHAKPYAVYIFNNGYGYVDGTNEYVYDFNLGDYVNKVGNAEANGKAYMQVLFSDYNKR